MQVSRNIGFLLILLASCIEPFTPDIDEMQELIVINGRLTDQPGEHFVEVSLSSPFNEPGVRPLRRCVVQVEDDQGTAVNYAEYKPGLYMAYLDESFLGVNKVYRLSVQTPDGEEYQSDYDSLLECPPLNDLYFAVESQATNNPDFTYYGLQFYVDVKSEGGKSRNFLWKLVETFEYHSPYFIQYILDDGSLEEFIPAIDSVSICYKTHPISELYTASTRFLVANELKHFPLNYVSGTLPKLKIKYSLLVSQHSLSDEAFLYWEKMRNQQNEAGGLYETQPSGSEGNICNINDDSEQVLGYFYASQVREKRIIINNSYDFPILDYSCPIDTVVDLDDLSGDWYLISLSPEGKGGPYGYADRGCFDCRLRGGSTNPPSYWNEDE